VGPDGLLDLTRFDAQGHRGGRNLRPENTLPAMEVALDNLLTTLETDCGITQDSVPVLDHDPHIEAAKTRRGDGQPYAYAEEVLVKDLTVAQIQSTFIADKLLADRPLQTNDRCLSPVSVAFTEKYGLLDPYVMPTLAQLFDFVYFYAEYYRIGAGKDAPDAEKRWKNAQRVRFNVETKITPRTDTDPKGDVFADRTVDAETFAKAVAEVIISKGLQERADVQNFDFRTLLAVQAQYPQIRTAYLFGDFPKLDKGGDDGTNLQPQGEGNTPWLAGWPLLALPVRGREQSLPGPRQRWLRGHGLRPLEQPPAAPAGAAPGGRRPQNAAHPPFRPEAEEVHRRPLPLRARRPRHGHRGIQPVQP
jgi:glycerophosphoryl diester phosphodiesterase